MAGLRSLRSKWTVKVASEALPRSEKGNHGGLYGACLRENGPALRYSRVCSMVFHLIRAPSERWGLSIQGQTFLSLSRASSKSGQARMMWSRVWRVGGWSVV